MNIKKYAVLLLVLGLTTGCVSTKNVPLTDEAITNIKGKDISLSSRQKADFAAMTAGKAMFGALGGAAMVSAGNKIIRNNSVDDPASYINQQLSSSLVEKYNVSVTSTDGIPVTGDKIPELVAAATSTYLLDVQTINWSFVYFPTNWDHYRVIYSAKLRLIDTKKKAIVSEGFCSSVPEESSTSPTYDELLLNQAERLKTEIKNAANYCVGEFKSKVLRI